MILDTLVDAQYKDKGNDDAFLVGLKPWELPLVNYETGPHRGQEETEERERSLKIGVQQV